MQTPSSHLDSDYIRQKTQSWDNLTGRPSDIHKNYTSHCLGVFWLGGLVAPLIAAEFIAAFFVLAPAAAGSGSVGVDRMNAPELDSLGPKLGGGVLGKTMDMPLPHIGSNQQTKGTVLYSVHVRWEVNKSIAIKTTSLLGVNRIDTFLKKLEKTRKLAKVTF